jgi:hypothetical protein
MTPNTPIIKILGFHPLHLELPALNTPVMAVTVQLPPNRIKLLDLSKSGLMDGQIIADLPTMNISVTLSEPLTIFQIVSTITTSPESWEGIWTKAQEYFDECQPILK